MDPIAREHHVITFDNCGVGTSTGRVPGSIEEMAEATYFFIAALGFNSVDILALSLREMVTQSLTVMHPELVCKPILSGTGPRGGRSTESEGIGETPSGAHGEPGCTHLLQGASVAAEGHQKLGARNPHGPDPDHPPRLDRQRE